MIYHCKYCGPGSLTIPGGDVCFDCYTQAHLAQQADGVTAKLIEAHRLAVQDIDAAVDLGKGRREIAECRADLGKAETALLAHVAGQAARHREEVDGLKRSYDAQTENVANLLNTADRLEAEVARLRARVAEIKQPQHDTPSPYDAGRGGLSDVR